MFPMGEGTERLEERLGDLLPSGTNVLRLDRDAGRNQERMEAILAKFARGEAQVLVGTQMLSKGHHFPDVTLAVAADADLGLNLPDYRAAERVFQLLVQVSGRAGRGEKPGRVLIQTRSPSHPFWDFVLRADYEGFFRRELEMRRRFGYPPFAKLGLIRLSHKAGDEGGASELTRLSSLLRERAAELGVRMLGPAPAPLAQLKGRLRFHCLCKADSWPDLRSLYAEARSAVGRDSPLRLNLDLDPLNML
jgi:primosomal protein N' (replication factor Y)